MDKKWVKAKVGHLPHAHRPIRTGWNGCVYATHNRPTTFCSGVITMLISPFPYFTASDPDLQVNNRKVNFRQV